MAAVKQMMTNKSKTITIIYTIMYFEVFITCFTSKLYIRGL